MFWFFAIFGAYIFIELQNSLGIEMVQGQKWITFLMGCFAGALGPGFAIYRIMELLERYHMTQIGDRNRKRVLARQKHEAQPTPQKKKRRKG